MQAIHSSCPRSAKLALKTMIRAQGPYDADAGVHKILEAIQKPVKAPSERQIQKKKNLERAAQQLQLGSSKMQKQPSDLISATHPGTDSPLHGASSVLPSPTPRSQQASSAGSTGPQFNTVSGFGSGSGRGTSPSTSPRHDALALTLGPSSSTFPVRPAQRIQEHSADSADKHNGVDTALRLWPASP